MFSGGIERDQWHETSWINMQRNKYSYISEQSQKVAPVLCVNTTPKDAYLRFI